MRVCLFADARSVHIQQLAPRLVAEGVEVHLATHKPAKVAGCTVERFRVPGVSPVNLRRWRGRYRAYLMSFLRDFDVVNIHFLQDWGFCAEGEDRELLGEGNCLVATAWGSDIVDPPGETPASPELVGARVAMLKGASVVTSCGPSFARTVERFADLRPGSVQVAGFGVDLRLFSREGARSKASKRPPCVGFFKGFRSVYGADRWVRAMPLVVNRLSDVRFDMVGDGPELSFCRELAESLNVNDRITWIPRQVHDALPRLLENWDVSVIPSVHEAFGVAALESSAMGVPVVGSDVPGLQDTVRHGETGVLVDTSDPHQLSGAIVDMLCDNARRRRMAVAGRTMVEREYQWSDLVRRWIEIYEMVRRRRCTMV